MDLMKILLANFKLGWIISNRFPIFVLFCHFTVLGNCGRSESPHIPRLILLFQIPHKYIRKTITKYSNENLDLAMENVRAKKLTLVQKFPIQYSVSKTTIFDQIKRERIDLLFLTLSKKTN